MDKRTKKYKRLFKQYKHCEDLINPTIQAYWEMGYRVKKIIIPSFLLDTMSAFCCLQMKRTSNKKNKCFTINIYESDFGSIEILEGKNLTFIVKKDKI